VGFKPLTQSQPGPISAANSTISRLRRWADQQTREVSSVLAIGLPVASDPSRPGV